MVTLQQKAFCMLKFRKTNAIVTVQRAFRTNFGIDPPYRKSIEQWVRLFKETGICAKKKILEYHVLQRSKWRGFTKIRLKTAHVSLQVEQVGSLRSRIPLSGVG